MRMAMLSLAAAAVFTATPDAVRAQEKDGNSSGFVIGPPQLKNFSLTPKERIVAQPPPEEQPSVEISEPAPPPQNTAAPVAVQPEQSEPAPSPRQVTQIRTPAPEPQTVEEVAKAPTVQTDPLPLMPASPELPDTPASADSAPSASSVEEPPASAEGRSYWFYAFPAFMLALLGAAAVRRRRRLSEAPETANVADVPPAPPRPQPVPRPWLELEMKVERSALTDSEAEVAFELSMRNSGKAAARNVRINARMFNAGAEQDKEIGAFFNTKGEGRRTFTIPLIEAGTEGFIQGTVTLPRDEMRAVSIDSRLLFIPVIAVNAVYDWGEGEAGQTSKSYIVGREVAGPDAKMGAFRVDLGPRVWRTVGQRQHRLARRV